MFVLFALKNEIYLFKNDLGLLKNTHIVKKHWSFHDFEEKKLWFVSLEVEKIIKVEKQFLLLNYAFVKKTQKQLLKWQF